MAYKGMPIFPQQEVASVRRTRKKRESEEVQQYGKKGMKWGRRNSPGVGRHPFLMFGRQRRRGCREARAC
jgi:hypothetical protein